MLNFVEKGGLLCRGASRGGLWQRAWDLGVHQSLLGTRWHTDADRPCQYNGLWRGGGSPGPEAAPLIHGGVVLLLGGVGGWRVCVAAGGRPSMDCRRTSGPLGRRRIDGPLAEKLPVEAFSAQLSCWGFSGPPGPPPYARTQSQCG